MTALVLQARLDSTRLPGKSLLPLGEKPMILAVMEALKDVPADLYVLACPEDNPDPFRPLAEQAGFTLLPGPKEDVLARYCLAVRRFNISRVIRATGDNPFVFADAAAAINNEAAALNAAYGSYRGIPLGAGVESVDGGALLQAEARASAPYDREHVCPYLYGHPETFSLHCPPVPRRWQGNDIRLTVDTAEDYERAKTLYAALSRLEDPRARRRGETIIAVYKETFRPRPGQETPHNRPAGTAKPESII
jgi:spore coat polysaccharide biosynthesis protein SpsF